MPSLDAFAAAKLAALEAQSLRRTLTPSRRSAGAVVERDGRRFVSFSCNDYLALSHHPAVKAAAIAAVETYGTGAAASRLVTGDHPLMAELERRLARFKGAEAACVFTSGYMTNAGVIPTFAGEGDLVLADALSHACIFAGAKLSGARTLVFRHNDLEHLAELLASERATARHALIVTEGVFSMDGDLAPVADLASLADEHDAWLMTDDAHGLGTIASGRGSGAQAAPGSVDLQMGTLSKALASVGGYVCAPAAAIDLIKTRARTLVYSTGLPPASAAAAIAALDIIETNPSLCDRPSDLARRFTRALNLPEAQSPIVPFLLGEPEAALSAQRRLEAEGFLVVAIRPPTVPMGAARLRFAFSAAHSDEDVDRLADAVRRIAA